LHVARCKVLGFRAKINGEPMHELALAESILDAVSRELQAYPGATPMRVGVKVGVLAAVDVEALRFCFEVALRGTNWSQLKLEAEVVSGEVHCLACDHRMRVKSAILDCERCGSTQTMMHGSDELDLTYLEIERDGNDHIEAEGAERKSENRRGTAPAI
jgi:hydrogenase nickel incorporation protein HypA/HybF